MTLVITKFLFTSVIIVLVCEIAKRTDMSFCGLKCTTFFHFKVHHPGLS